MDRFFRNPGLTLGYWLQLFPPLFPMAAAYYSNIKFITCRFRDLNFTNKYPLKGFGD